MKQALPMGKMAEVHQYGRSLLAQKRGKEAFEVFKMNHAKNPEEFTTLMGMTRGYSAIGDYKKALEFAQKTLPKAPDDNAKATLTTMIEKLKKGENAN
jgi:tetratricopeptide (TPR) repeat protein